MSKIDEYKARAVAAAALAETASDELISKHYRVIATQWQLLAHERMALDQMMGASRRARSSNTGLN